MNLSNTTSLYFIGAGGIGMSALIRYFLSIGKRVAGYDKVPSDLTGQLNTEGAEIHYEDDVSLIPSWCREPESTLVVYTPAVPDTLSELGYFRTRGFEVVKRAQLLGLITEHSKGLCVAGTHGKTTTSSMLAHLLKQSHVDCNAFLGGILKGYESNLMLSAHSDFTVVEADEFDRSFHWLTPYMAIITSADPDHLDIYGTPEAYRESFEKFTSLIQPGGTLLMKKGIDISPRLQKEVKCFTYAVEEEADFYAENIRVGNGDILFDFRGPGIHIKNIRPGVPVRINVENGVAAIAVAMMNGVTPEEIKEAMAAFAGSRRRFDFQLKTDSIVMIDDYAHHPEELQASIRSVKEIYAGKRVTGVFQPHLYTRTRDFADAFANSLSLLDELILLDIYPAREEPIPGVDSQMILDKVTIPNKRLCRKEELTEVIKNGEYEIVLMLGAGDIDRLVQPVKETLKIKYKQDE